ncbi:hypothetical protein FKP32DRAFT_996112 [Trametes sanguinea]|nr:hypothetical protein FKP32DRAFT_996112 [Trametes sanguinea]
MSLLTIRLLRTAQIARASLRQTFQVNWPNSSRPLAQIPKERLRSSARRRRRYHRPTDGTGALINDAFDDIEEMQHGLQMGTSGAFRRIRWWRSRTSVSWKSSRDHPVQSSVKLQYFHGTLQRSTAAQQTEEASAGNSKARLRLEEDRAPAAARPGGVIALSRSEDEKIWRVRTRRMRARNRRRHTTRNTTRTKAGTVPQNVTAAATEERSHRRRKIAGKRGKGRSTSADGERGQGLVCGDRLFQHPRRRSSSDATSQGIGEQQAASIQHSLVWAARPAREKAANPQGQGVACTVRQPTAANQRCVRLLDRTHARNLQLCWSSSHRWARCVTSA